MKNKLKILTLLVLSVFLLQNCQRDPDLNWPDLKNGIVPLVEKDGTKNLVIFDNNIAGFSGGVSVDLYYPDKPKSMSLMVSMNDDPDNSATVIADITTFPVSYNFTAANLVDLLPELNSAAEIVAGDFFRFYCDITLADGTVLRGNDALYTAFSSGIANLPGSSTSVVYNVACGYEPALAAGAYTAVSPADQWAISGPITITVDAADNTKLYITGLAALDGVDEDRGPLVMHINPATFAVTVDKTVLVSTWYYGYTNFTYEGTGTFNSCNGNYSLKLKPCIDQGCYSSYSYTFTRD